MSKLNELIKTYCPDGVIFMRLEDVASYMDGAAHEGILGDEGKYIVTKVKFISSDGQFKKYCDTRLSPVEKDDVIMVMSDLPNGKSLAKCFLIDKDGTYTINQRVCSLTANKNILNPRFLYYVLNRNKQLLKYDNGYNQTHLKKQWILDVRIPVPPMPIQNEIVSILDRFKALVNDLSNELELQKTQYDEAAYRLLIKGKDFPKYDLSDICELSKGKTGIQKAIPGEFPLVVTATERKSSNTYQFDEPAVCIPLVSSRGHGVASLNHVYYQEGKFALGSILCGVTVKDKSLVSAKYLYYYFECTKDYTLVPLMKGGANVSMTVSDIAKVKVPIPSISEQKEIISKLEVLDEYCNIALPAEIEARQKQYEYYRDKLLTFKEVNA